MVSVFLGAFPDLGLNAFDDKHPFFLAYFSRRRAARRGARFPTVQVGHIRKWHEDAKNARDGQKSVLCGVALDNVERLVHWT